MHTNTDRGKLDPPVQGAIVGRAPCGGSINRVKEHKVGSMCTQSKDLVSFSYYNHACLNGDSPGSRCLKTDLYSHH